MPTKAQIEAGAAVLVGAHAQYVDGAAAWNAMAQTLNAGFTTLSDAGLDAEARALFAALNANAAGTTTALAQMKAMIAAAVPPPPPDAPTDVTATVK